MGKTNFGSQSLTYKIGVKAQKGKIPLVQIPNLFYFRYQFLPKTDSFLSFCSAWSGTERQVEYPHMLKLALFALRYSLYCVLQQHANSESQNL